MNGWVQLATGGAGALAVMAVGLWLFANGKIHSHREMQRVEQALEREQEAHDRTREALAVANARADSGLEPARIIASVLSSQRSISP